MLDNFKKKFLNFLQVKSFKKESDETKVILGHLLSEYNSKKIPKNVQDIEFKVFSQFGDDGIIQYLLDKINLDEEQKIFVEFGVENYEESNTRFLLSKDNWSGLVIDSSEKNIREIKKSHYFWKYDLEAICSFVTKNNINNILEKSKISKKIGLLSIDVDGNDYWIWENINLVDPILVIVEFNSNFGFDKKITVPYKEKFVRSDEHYSNLYWGASLPALKYLANKKNYEFLCTNTAGNNAYFLKKSFFHGLNLNFKKNFFESKFRESRDRDGAKTFLKGKNKLKLIEEMEVIDVEKNKKFKIKEILSK